jgi:scyllo-inositol 2-dehydrogenase (NADP+)
MGTPNAVVIGYGYAGRAFHSYLVGLEENLSLHGVCSRNAETRERIEQERGCTAYESFEQVLADADVDLVILASPNDVHASQAIAAMDAGKHVVTDKPMCLRLQDGDAMIAAAERNNVMLQVFQNRRWDGDFLTVRQLMDEGTLGEVRWLEMAWQVFRAPGGWRGQQSHGGGRFWDLGAHMLDQVLLLKPQAVTSVYSRMQYDYDQRDVESHALCVLGFADGATAVIDAGGMHALPKPRFRLLGRDGAFVKFGLDPQEDAMRQGKIDAAVEPEDQYGTYSDGEKQTSVPTLRGDWKQFYRNVAEVLADRAEPAVRFAEMRRVLAVFDAAFQSARNGQVVATDIPALD